ncbi:2-methylcitrate dehydratase [Bacillus tianshenii]|nr:2-methylcitrate dehydratase [Bacillus tianshenii]
MPYIDYKALVKNAQIKKDGIVEIKLEAPVNLLKGKVDSLSEMVGGKVDISMESAIVNFSVEVNTQTDTPMIQYKVDQRGVVSEVKPDQEQLEADLGMPAEDIPTKEEKKEIDREVIDQFISEGFSPNYDDLPGDFANIVKRRLEGETYLKLANELDMSSGKIVDLIDEYRVRVAPLAEKWWEWKQGESSSSEDKEEEVGADKKEPDSKGAEDDQSEDGAA